MGVRCGRAFTLHFFVTGGPRWVPMPSSCLIWCVLSLIACPTGCLQCSRRDRCHLCDQGLFLKSGLCLSNCVPGFSAHSSNETCAGKCFSPNGLVKSPVISPCRGWVCRYGWPMWCKMQASHSGKNLGAAVRDLFRDNEKLGEFNF